MQKPKKTLNPEPKNLMLKPKKGNIAVAKASNQASSLKVWDDVQPDAFDDIDRQIKSFSAGEYVKLEEGRNVLRFLPPRRGEKPYKIVYEHFVEGLPGHEGTFRFVCPRYTTKNKMRCPRCEEGDRLRTSNNPLDRKASREYYPAQRIYANVINRDSPEEGPKILSFGKMIWGQLKEIREDPDNGGAYWNPEEDGFDIVINRKGTGKTKTEYSTKIAKRNSPLHESFDQVVDWIQRQPNLEQCATLMDPDELLDALGGGSPRGRRSLRDADEDEPRRSLPSGSDGGVKPKKRPKRTAQDELDGPVIDAEYSAEDDIPF